MPPTARSKRRQLLCLEPLNIPGKGMQEAIAVDMMTAHRAHRFPTRLQRRKISPSAMGRQRGLFDLPLELRIQIYGYLLSTKYARQSCERPAHRKRKFVPRPEYSYELSPAVLATNHQIHAEALPFFSNNLFVSIRCQKPCFLENLVDDGLPIVARHQHPLTRCVMEITIIHHVADGDSPHENATISASDLSLLCELLMRYKDTAWEYRHIYSLKIEFMHPLNHSPRATFDKLLEPLRVLRDFSSVYMSTTVHIPDLEGRDDYVDDIIQTITSNQTNAFAWHEFAKSKEEEGNAHFHANNFTAAIAAYDEPVSTYLQVRKTTLNWHIPTAHIHLLQSILLCHLHLSNFVKALDYSNVTLRAIEDARADVNILPKDIPRRVQFFYQRELASVESGIDIPDHVSERFIRGNLKGDTPLDRRGRNAYFCWRESVRMRDVALRKAILNYLVFSADERDVLG